MLKFSVAKWVEYFEIFYLFIPKAGDNPTSKTETILRKYQNHIHTLALPICQIYKQCE